MKNKPQNIADGKLLKLMRGGSPSERLLHRLHAVALVLHGLSASEVARIFCDSPRAVAYWVTRFKKDGLKGLGEDSRPGRPSKLTALQKKKLEAFIKQSRVGSQPAKAKKLSQYIFNEFGISITIRQCWRILKKMSS